MTPDPDPAQDPDARRGELGAGLAAVRERIARAGEAAGRRPEDLTLVVVTKTHPAADVLHLAALGVRDVAESREQELRAKRDEIDPVADDQERPALRWHFVGRLQRNKARRVAAACDLVHSLDRPALVEPLARGAADDGRTLDVLVQVSLDGDTTRGGVPVVDGPGALLDLAAAVAAGGHLRLRGVMAVAPMDVDPRRAFAALPGLHSALRAEHLGADVVSAGMSGDLEAAIEAGATHLRVGSAILGARQSLR